MPLPSREESSEYSHFEKKVESQQHFVPEIAMNSAQSARGQSPYGLSTGFFADTHLLSFPLLRCSNECWCMYILEQVNIHGVALTSDYRSSSNTQGLENTHTYTHRCMNANTNIQNAGECMKVFHHTHHHTCLLCSPMLENKP